MNGTERDSREKTRRPARQTPYFEPAAANALPLTATEDKQYAFLAHCGGILGFIPALVIHLIFKDRGPFTAQESKEALNFTLPLTILAIIANILAWVFPSIGGVFALVSVLIWGYLTVSALIAAIHVNNGNPYRYPLNLRIIR